MGKLGPYQCFTVNRDPTTVISRQAANRDEDANEVFYDVKTTMQDLMVKSSNRYKSKFLRSQRFDVESDSRAPSPTKYYPQNYVLKPKSSPKAHVNLDKPLLYYPSTTVPVREMLFNKEAFPRVAPGRYDPHDVTCKCYLTKALKRCPGNVVGDGHRHVFQSTIFRLVQPVQPSRRKYSIKPAIDDNAIQYYRPPREPISFRKKRSSSIDNLMMTGREIHFNTMVKKKNLFSVKTGRPVAFLAASPRFQEASEISLKLEKEKRKLAAMEMQPEKPRRKAITRKRLSELAAPKNPLPHLTSSKAKVFEPLQQSALFEPIDKISIAESISGMSEVTLETETDEPAFKIGISVNAETTVE